MQLGMYSHTPALLTFPLLILSFPRKRESSKALLRGVKQACPCESRGSNLKCRDMMHHVSLTQHGAPCCYIFEIICKIKTENR